MRHRGRLQSLTCVKILLSAQISLTLWLRLCTFFSGLICGRRNGVLCTYFHIAAGQVSHFSWISLFHNTNLKRNKKIRLNAHHSRRLWLILTRAGNKANLNGRTPADNESGVVLPAQAARVHVGPQTHIIPQHIGDPLLCADVIYFYSLKVNKQHFYIRSCAYRSIGVCLTVAEISPHCWPMQSG